MLKDADGDILYITVREEPDQSYRILPASPFEGAIWF